MSAEIKHRYWRCVGGPQEGLCVSSHRSEGAALKHCERLAKKHGGAFRPEGRAQFKQTDRGGS